MNNDMKLISEKYTKDVHLLREYHIGNIINSYGPEGQQRFTVEELVEIFRGIPVLALRALVSLRKSDKDPDASGELHDKFFTLLKNSQKTQ